MSSAAQPESANGSLRIRRLLLPQSLRVRLTLWFALVLIVVLTVGVNVLMTLRENQLMAQTDAGLGLAVESVEEAVLERSNGRPLLPANMPELGTYLTDGRIVQVLSLDGSVVAATDGFEQEAMPWNGVATHAKSFETSDYLGASYRIVSTGVHLHTSSGESFLGTVIVGQPMQPIAATIDALWRLIVAVGTAGVVIVLLITWYIAGGVLQPIRSVTAAASSIAEHGVAPDSLSSRIAVPSNAGETAELAASFNTMLDRLEHAFEVQRRFVADASHELRTPLTAIHMNAELMLSEHREDPDLGSGLSAIKRGTERMERLVNDLLRLATADASDWRSGPEQTMRWGVVARQAIESLGPLLDDVALNVHLDDHIRVTGNRDALHELVVILLDNAIRYSPSGASMRVDLKADGGRAVLTVMDNGPGIPPESIDHLFERFYRVDKSRSRQRGGSGLGLAIAKSIVEAHAGRIRVESTLGAGTTFIVDLPEAHVQAGTDQKDAADPRVAKGAPLARPVPAADS